MSKFLSGLKALVCAVAALICGGAWAGDLVWESLGTALLGKDSYTSLGWQVSDIATLKTYKFWGAIGGGNVNSQQYKGAIGYDATEVQDGSDSVLAVDMRAIDDNYVKSVLVYLKIDNGVVQAKAAQVSWKSGGTITTQYVNPSTLQPQNSGSVADPVTSNGDSGYGLATLRATTETEFPLEVGPLGRNTSSTFGKEQKQSSRSHYMLSKRLVPGSGNTPHTTYGESFPSSSFTVSTYVNIDAAQVPENKSAVIWSYGGAAGTPTPKLILTVIPGGKIKLYNFDGNTLDVSKTLTSDALVGWHLVTVTFDATSGTTMTIDDGARSSNATMNHTPGKEYQIASIHGTIGISDGAFTNGCADQIFIEDILVFNGVLSESRVTSLSAAYPKDDSTRSYTISSSIADGTKKVYKGGSDTVTLSAANSHSGGTEIFGGTLKMGINSALGGEGRKATVHFGATLDLAGNNSYKLWPTLDGGTLASSTGNPSYGNTMMAGMTLTADSTVDISGTRNGIVTNGYNATTIDLAGHKLTKTGSGEFCLAKVTLTEGTLRIEEGTVRQFHGNNGENTPGYDNNGQGDFSAAKVEIVGEGTKVVGSYTQTFKEIDLTEFTGSTAPFEKLTVTADTIWHFPSMLEENAPLTICTSALTAAQTTVSNVRAYVGSAAKLVNLTYNTASKTVSYALVRDMLYCFHLDGSVENVGVGDNTKVSQGTSISYVEGGALDSAKGLTADNNSHVKVYDENGLVSNEQGWTVSFWVNSVDDGYWCNHGILRLGNKYYKLQHAGSNKKVNIYPEDTTVASDYTGISLVTSGVWHNIILVSDGENIKIYLDGALNSTYSPKAGQHLYGTGFAGLTGFTAGEEPTIAGNGSTKTDEVAIYSAALTENEIKLLSKIKPVNVIGAVALVDDSVYTSYGDAVSAATTAALPMTLVNTGVTRSSISVPANKTLTIANAENLEYTESTSFGGAGNVVLEFHTPSTYASNSALVTFIKSALTRITCKFYGDNSANPKTGSTLDFGVGGISTALNSHIAFVSGKHTLTIGVSAGGKDLATGNTKDAPVILVDTDAEVDLTSHYLSGYSNQINDGCWIRVNDGGTLNMKKGTDARVWYPQSLYLEPGATLTHNFPINGTGNDAIGGLGLHGGVVSGKYQIYVPTKARASSDTATIHSTASEPAPLGLADDSNKGISIFVDEGSKLLIDSGLLPDRGAAKVYKYGTGELIIRGSVTVKNTGDDAIAVKEGSLDLSGATLNVSGKIEVTIGTDVKVPNGTDSNKITAKYGDTSLSDKVEATIDAEGNVVLDVTPAAKPNVTAMAATTEDETDKVSFTFTPTPGLFYSVETADDPAFTNPTAGESDQATSTATKTLKANVGLTEQKKVQYFRVKVSANPTAN